MESFTDVLATMRIIESFMETGKIQCQGMDNG
jgi:hypothetical protein